MTYPEVVDYLYERLPVFSRVGASAFKKDLTNINALCAALGHPQRQFKSIHVGGTNGKGSVCHTLAAVFQESGYKTGLHTSPHLRDFRERFRIDGAMAPESFVVHFVEDNREMIEEIQPSFFEISVAMAFSWFAESQVDIALVEVGLGGRLDSTNVISPELSIITNISLEHTQFLGDTRTKIAREKAGIIKPQTPVVAGESDKETTPVFNEIAQAQKAPLYFADQLYVATQQESFLEGQRVKVKKFDEKEACEFVLDLGGNYQLQNLQTVLCAVQVLQDNGWKLPAGQVKRALGHVKEITGLRGRWEILERRPLVIADVGHNVAGIQQVMNQIRGLAFNKLFIVTGFVQDKNVKAVMQFLPTEAIYFFCQADNPRAMPAEEVRLLAAEAGLQGTTKSSVCSAFEEARRLAGPDDVIVICGSTFIVAEILI